MVKKKKMSKTKMKRIINKLFNNRYFVVGCAVAFFAVVCGTFFFIFNYCRFDNFKVKSRVDNIAKDKASDVDGAKTIGWLRVQGTNIDYPVLYVPSISLSDISSDFAWVEREFDSLPNNLYVSGHNIKNLSKNPEITDKDHNRFEQLLSFTYYDFIKDNQYIQFTFGGKDYVYKIFSVSYPLSTNRDAFNFEDFGEEEMNKYLKKEIVNSIYDMNVNVKSTDKIITLSTCTRMYGADRDFRVSARLLREDEKIKLSKVEKTSLYEEIENIMKGDEVNENN